MASTQFMTWDRVWVGLTDTERLSRYYLALGDRLRRQHRWLTYLTIFLASGAIASLLTSAPGWVPLLVTASIAAAATWSNLADYSAKASMAHAISGRCRNLMVSWERLWYDNKREPDPREVDALEQLLNEISNQTQLDENKRLHRAAQKEAYAICAEQYQQ